MLPLQAAVGMGHRSWLAHYNSFVIEPVISDPSGDVSRFLCLMATSSYAKVHLVQIVK